ncbi:MAG: polysaccharide deacetylase family protein [Chloroflexi bacterium]|nr:polysaccharide deacetylase family protein [Chloroflexota bacterium]
MPDSRPASTFNISRRHFLQWGAGAALAPILAGTAPASVASDARIIRQVSTNERKVCLTYDDLWSEYYALRIGREYQRRNVRLTLFPAGRAVLNNLERPNPGYENLYPRLRDMGHEFGCHLFTHRVIKDMSLQQLIDEEMAPTLHVMRRALGSSFRPVGIRPPYGHVTDAVKQLSARYDMPLILWGLDSQDAICTKRNEGKTCACKSQANFDSYARIWGPQLTNGVCAEQQCPEVCVDLILNNYRSYLRPGTIILHHTVKTALLAIEPSLDLLRNWNMQPISLTELLSLAS